MSTPKTTRQGLVVFSLRYILLLIIRLLRRTFENFVGVFPESVVAAQFPRAFRLFRFLGSVWVKLGNRVVPVDPGNFTLTFFYHLVHGGVKYFTKRAVQIGIFHYDYFRVHVSQDMVVQRDRPHVVYHGRAAICLYLLNLHHHVLKRPGAVYRAYFLSILEDYGKWGTSVRLVQPRF